ncbi:SnoaL-like domain-containing protein [Polaribacter sp. KT25b]|uniref:nuclear transport factor 2 family protein n=1 Tax=Polaribacter sp. KT25b TaxID=1855336 RepID=UPI00087A4CAD|nr:nuclear transport factor 2 family protein [Polaribacter sp. KT25b]SDS49180.1 SnoaL-like domain-containing protein [Polaribacter sp. KT25b]
MKKAVLLFVFLMILVSCKSTLKPISFKNQQEIKKAVNTVLDDWHLAATEANFENYFNKMDSISIFIGTDATENWTKKQFMSFSKPFFDKGKAWDFKTLERTIYVNASGDFVWFDELLNTWMGTCRGSGVLEKSNNEWKIKQYVLSVSIPNDDVQAVIAAKKKNDAIFLKKFN